MKPKLKYDKKSDASYIKLSDKKVVSTENVALGINIDFDADGIGVGVEIYGRIIRKRKYKLDNLIAANKIGYHDCP